MTKEAKAMINMAEAIAKMCDTAIERLDLQRHYLETTDSEYYSADVWFGNGKKMLIRNDCSFEIR